MGLINSEKDENKPSHIIWHLKSQRDDKNLSFSCKLELQLEAHVQVTITNIDSDQDLFEAVCRHVFDLLRKLVSHS